LALIVDDRSAMVNPAFHDDQASIYGDLKPITTES